MRQTFEFIPTLKDVSSDAVITSHKMMLRGGYAQQIAAGIYTYLPLGYKIIRKIENIIREELNNINCTEIYMPVLQPKTLWDETGRWDLYGENLMTVKDRHNRDFAMGPTHEEIITEIVRTHIKSYKKLPLALYQIQTKFRDEFRPRFGLMRAREFLMKDLYTFHDNKEDFVMWYNNVSDAYHRIFNRCGLDFVRIEADNGEIGGDESHEFAALSEVCEDVITYCEKCDFAANVEKSNLKTGDKCPKCGAPIFEKKGIEIGHIFQLGTKYSNIMNAKVNSREGQLIPIEMGCYGLGVSRVLMALLEQITIDDVVVWPSEVAPYDVHIIIANMKDNDLVEAAFKLYEEIKKQGKTCLIDDRDDRVGSKLKDAELIGIPEKYVFGRDFKDGYVEYHNQRDVSNVAVGEIL